MSNTANMECGCLNGSVGIIQTGIIGSLGVIDTYPYGTVGFIPTLVEGSIGLVNTYPFGAVGLINTNIEGSVGIICTPNTGIILRFENDRLLWEKEENVVGVTKYNVLIASDGWELKEVEELL